MPRRAELPNFAPARLDINHYRGDTLSIRLRLRSQGVPVDISNTGWEFKAQVRSSPDGPVLCNFFILEDDIYSDGSGSTRKDGIIRMMLTETSSQALEPVSSWDFQVKEEINKTIHVRTLLRGFIYTSLDITTTSSALNAFSEGR